MDATQIPLFSLADRRLGYLNERQMLLAKDIANASTPGWRDQDLKGFDATLSALSAAAEPVQTNPLHLSGTTGGISQPDRMKRPAEKAPDGNAVSLQDDMVKMADNDDSHELVTNLYKSYLGMFNTALGR
jgi:flagellar basal-body rod protein FlgB